MFTPETDVLTAYVSLFGLKTDGALEDAVFAQLHPGFAKVRQGALAAGDSAEADRAGVRHHR